jgi:hypothetical protein
MPKRRPSGNATGAICRCIKIGVQKEQGDLAGALKSYAIIDRRVKSDPGNADRQRDLSVSYDRIGKCKRRRATLPAR